MLPRFAKHCNIVTVNLQQRESIILWVAKVFLPLGCSEWEEGESDIQVCTAVIEHVKGQSGNNTKDEAFLKAGQMIQNTATNVPLMLTQLSAMQ